MSAKFYKKFTRNLLIVTGACRTGKTTLCKALAHNQRVEFLDEPWLPMFLPVLLDQGQLNSADAGALLQAYFDELCNDMLLYRRANFRPEDSSSIWSFKKAKDIFYRLNKVNSRDDVEAWITENNTVFVIALPEVTPFIRYFLTAFTTCLVLNMSRDDEAIAKLIADKSWYGDQQLIQPINNQPYHLHRVNGMAYHLPWWLECEQFDKFISQDDYHRGLIYAQHFSSVFECQKNSLPASQLQRLLNIDFDQYVNNENVVLKQIHGFIDRQFKLVN